MKQTSNKNRSNSRHGRFNNNRRANNLITRNTVFDSSSPSGRNRGTSQQLVEKYMSLAKDAKNQDDRVLYETYLQYADHYGRMLALAIANEQPKQPSVVVEETMQEEGVEKENSADVQKETTSEVQEEKTAVETSEVSEDEQAKEDIIELKEVSKANETAPTVKPKVQRKPRKVVIKKEKVSKTKDTEQENPEPAENV